MAALRGHSELVDLLCKYGADTENVSKLAAGSPGKYKEANVGHFFLI